MGQQAPRAPAGTPRAALHEHAHEANHGRNAHRATPPRTSANRPDSVTATPASWALATSGYRWERDHGTVTISDLGVYKGAVDPRSSLNRAVVQAGPTLVTAAQL